MFMRKFVRSGGIKMIPRLKKSSASFGESASSEKPEVPEAPPSLKTRAVAMGALPPAVRMSSEPTPLVLIDATMSG